MAWSEAFKHLWSEFECYYYACPQFTINALGHDIDEVVAWMAEISEGMDN